jgi:hypothetical protein
VGVNTVAYDDRVPVELDPPFQRWEGTSLLLPPSPAIDGPQAVRVLEVFDRRGNRLITLGLGSHGLGHLVKEGALSVVLVGVGLAADALLARLLDDDRALAELNRTWRPELTKAVLTSIASSAAALLVAGTGTVVWPLTLSVAVGLGVSLGLDYLEGEYHPFEKLFAALDRYFRQVEGTIEASRKAYLERGLPLWEDGPPFPLTDPRTGI